MTSAFSFAVLLILFSFVDVRDVAAGVLLFLGFTMPINGPLANGILQSIVRDELWGRVMAGDVFVYVGLPQSGH